MELQVRDIEQLTEASITDPDFSTFKRKYRWICTNVEYEDIDKIFVEDKELVQDFISGLTKASGVDITQL